MASVHYKLSIISRSEGRSTVAAAAYRAGERLHNLRDGLTHDYTKKRGVVHKEILLPDHAPREFAERAFLWNAVEKAEKQKNAQLSRDLIIGLPVELDHAAQIELIRAHVQCEYVSRGMCADICIHDPKKKDQNPHAHVMLTMRPLEQNGRWGAKSQKEYILDRQGQRIVLPSGEYKSRKVSTTDWDDRNNIEKWRKSWEHDVNREYERRGLEVRICMESYERQGLDKEPTERMSREELALENQGIATKKGERNRDVRERNAARERQREPSFEQWQRGREPQKEQHRGMERGR